MGLLKLSRYLELPDGILPITRCKKGDIVPYVIITNTREQVEKGAELLSDVRIMIKGDEAALTVTGIYEELPITISNGGVGVGQTSNVMEELIRIGGQVFIQLGAVGAIQENINLGDIIIPTGSVRDEGLTDYYAPKQYPAVADYRIVRALAEAATEEKYRFHTGIIRTTEGFYPSQRVEEYVKTYHDLGVLGVEQEVSGILTICSTHGCFAGACLMVIGNLVKGQHYMKGDEYEHLDRVWFEQIKVIFKAMQYLRKDNFPGTTE